MWALYQRVVACAEGAARAAGAGLTVTQNDNVYEPLKRNQVLLDLFAANLGAVGLSEGPAVPDRLGSSDVGNVSQVVPCIQPLIGIAPLGTAIHTRAFADFATQPLAQAATLAAAKTMALTALDLLAEPARVEAAKAEFARA
jgi:metal-dependent amidase/aminoacylase/carboxypeptidase family protein